MNDDAFFERNITDYLFAPKRIAASGTVDQKVIDTFDDDRVLAHANKLADGFHPRL